MQCALGMIFLGYRDAECRHDCVADELLDRPARALDFLAHRGEETLQPKARSLGILLSGLGRADQVREQHRRELSLMSDGQRLGRKPWSRGGRLSTGQIPGLGKVERATLSEDRSLQLPERRRRLDAELSDERAADILVCIQRLRLPARTVTAEP